MHEDFFAASSRCSQNHPFPDSPYENWNNWSEDYGHVIHKQANSSEIYWNQGEINLKNQKMLFATP